MLDEDEKFYLEKPASLGEFLNYQRFIAQLAFSLLGAQRTSKPWVVGSNRVRGTGIPAV